MEREALTKNIALAASIAVISIVVLTAAGELNAAFKNLLTSTFTHHWIGKSLISILVFTVCLAFLAPLKLKISLTRSIWILTILVNLSFAFLFLFFLLEAL